MHLSSSRWCLPFLCMASCDVKSAMPWCLRCQGVRPFRPARKQRTVPGCSTFVARPEIPANTRVFGPRVFSPSDPPGNIGLFTRCVSDTCTLRSRASVLRPSLPHTVLAVFFKSLERNWLLVVVTSVSTQRREIGVELLGVVLDFAGNCSSSGLDSAYR